MAKINLDDHVKKAGDHAWDVECPVTDGTCGADGVPFRSTGWPTKASARARLDEHVAEHKGEGAMSSLEDFRAKHGLSVDENGNAVVSAKDL